nr:hypothetical protein [Tanacetum cinerariifolium]
YKEGCSKELQPERRSFLIALRLPATLLLLQTLGSGISILLAVGTPSTGSGILYCQWELSPSSGNALCILFPTNVLEILMQQFWYTIKKVQDTDSYEILLANKKCTVNAEVFMTILDICLRVKGEDFTNVLDDETALTFLIDLGYKGQLNMHTNMFVDHMHQPWRNLAAIINKENVDYLELIWEDLAYQIDHRKEKRSRRENMPYPRKYYQEYGYPIHDVMLTDAIKRSKSYQMFIKYLTHQIPPKKSRGKGLKGKKTAEASQKTINVSKELEPELEPAKKKIASRRVVKKKVTMLADDNIISNDPDDTLELAKSISQTKAKEVEAARKVHATHARIVPESISEYAKKKSSGRSSKSVGDKQDSEFSDDDNDDDDEKDDKDGDVDDEEDVEMKDGEVEKYDKGEEKVTDAAKEEAEKTSKAKDDTKKFELPLSSSSLSLSSGFGDQFLKLSSNSSLVSTIKDFADANVSSLLNLSNMKLPRPSKKTKRKRTKEYESSKNPSSTKETPKGKAPTKGFKTCKSALTKEPVEEPIAEVIMNDAGDDMARDDDQPQATLEPKKRKTLNSDWVKQPPRLPTPDPKWNKRQVVIDQPAQPWFNQMVSALKDPLTFNDPMAIPIDFFKYVGNEY